MRHFFNSLLPGMIWGVTNPKGGYMLNIYETVLITIPDIPEDALKTIKSRIEGSISKEEGEIVKNDDWGVRKLAYEIKHNKKGKYLYYNYKAKPTVVSEIEKNLRLDERVIRFMTVRMEIEKPAKVKAEKPKKTEIK